MSDPDYPLAEPITVRFQRQAVDRILESVEEYNYSALLGPRLCGKSVLLRYVESYLINQGDWLCTIIDLEKITTGTMEGFFANLMTLVSDRLQQQTGLELPPPRVLRANSVIFRGHLADSLEVIKRDLVLIIDNLDAIPTDLIQALLTSLRAAYMDQQDRPFQVIVIVSGALSLANLTVGESSPFRGIARRIFVGDLSRDQSRQLIGDFLAAEGVSSTSQAQKRLLEATSGDPYLIRKLCQRCVDSLNTGDGGRLRTRSVNRIIAAFIRDDVAEYAPLVEAVRLIEEDPDLMRSILRLLETDRLPKSALQLPLSPDLDPLYLTGVIERTEGDRYRIQNRIYRTYLQDHFHPGRVGHLLAMAGLWDEAIDYLEAGIQSGDRHSRAELLPATIQSMYAARDLNQAAYFLSRGLIAGFGAWETTVWFAQLWERRLEIIGSASQNDETPELLDPVMDFQADRLEARAFRQGAILRAGETSQGLQRAIPLTIPGRDPVGVVSIRDGTRHRGVQKQRDHDLQLRSYLNQAGRALLAVATRRQELTLAGRMQASLLPEAPPSIPGWQVSATWKPARETSGDFYDFVEYKDGRLGVILADVTDKGMGAALYMALSRTLLRTYALAYPDHPEKVLAAANQRMLADTHGGLFIPLFYGLIDPQSGRMVYCNGGHHPPFFFPYSRSQEPQALSRTGMALGISSEAAWIEKAIHFQPGDTLVVYTDGVVEAQNAEAAFFGDERMQATVKSLAHRSPRHIQDAILSEVRAFTANEPQFDDLTLVIIKREERSAA